MVRCGAGSENAREARWALTEWLHLMARCIVSDRAMRLLGTTSISDRWRAPEYRAAPPNSTPIAITSTYLLITRAPPYSLPLPGRRTDEWNGRRTARSAGRGSPCRWLLRRGAAREASPSPARHFASQGF